MNRNRNLTDVPDRRLFWLGKKPEVRSAERLSTQYGWFTGGTRLPLLGRIQGESVVTSIKRSYLVCFFPVKYEVCPVWRESEGRMIHRLTKSSLALNTLGRCLTNHLTSIKIINRGVVSVEQGNDSDNNELYDVIISGGGMVGSAMACSLGE